MLPFMKPRKIQGVIVDNRKADGSKHDKKTQEDHGLNQAAEDLIRAIHDKDIDAAAAAMRAAFEILDSQPHEEYPHEDEDEKSDE
jgi:hypothetical protein